MIARVTKHIAGKKGNVSSGLGGLSVLAIGGRHASVDEDYGIGFQYAHRNDAASIYTGISKLHRRDRIRRRPTVKRSIRRR